MDVNCSGYTGLQPGAAAHFFAQSPAALVITRTILILTQRLKYCGQIIQMPQKKNVAEK